MQATRDANERHFVKGNGLHVVHLMLLVPGLSIFPTANLANTEVYAFYFRSNNPKQWSTTTSKNNINKQQD